MAKCGSCGKFLSNTNCVRCTKCPAAFHRDCAGVPEAAGVKAAVYVCPECLAKPQKSSLATPVRELETTQNPSPLVSAVVSPGISTHDVIPSGTDIVSLATDIRSIRNEISALRSEVREYRDEISDFKAELQTHSNSITTIEKRMSVLEEKFEKIIPLSVDPIESTIADLRCQLNDRDQELLLNDVEVAGIPESKDENLTHLIKVLTVKLGIELEDRDIVHIERVGSTRRNRIDVSSGNTSLTTDPAMQRPRCVSIRFARRVTREQLLRAARTRRGITSCDLEVQGASSRIYVNERLTHINRQLFYYARQAGNRHNWKYVWTRDGKILARREEGQKTERIKCQNDIDKFFG